MRSAVKISFFQDRDGSVAVKETEREILGGFVGALVVSVDLVVVLEVGVGGEGFDGGDEPVLDSERETGLSGRGGGGKRKNFGDGIAVDAEGCNGAVEAVSKAVYPVIGPTTWA